GPQALRVLAHRVHVQRRGLLSRAARGSPPPAADPGREHESRRDRDRVLLLDGQHDGQPALVGDHVGARDLPAQPVQATRRPGERQKRGVVPGARAFAGALTRLRHRFLDSWWWVVVAVALAAALRTAHVLALRPTPWFDHLVVDPDYYDEWARRIAAARRLDPIDQAGGLARQEGHGRDVARRIRRRRHRPESPYRDALAGERRFADHRLIVLLPAAEPLCDERRPERTVGRVRPAAAEH